MSDYDDGYMDGRASLDDRIERMRKALEAAEAGLQEAVSHWCVDSQRGERGKA